VSLFKRRRFPVEIILLCVRWYCKYGISYRDLAEMMSERGATVSPSTIFRWVQRYAPEIESKPPRSHVDFERRASSGLSYDGGCSGGLLWHRVFALAQSLPFPWQHFMEA
jgi:hypothetical protein